jgi:hypothetical protein
MTVVSVEKDVDGLSLILVADFDAPIERVSELWADARELERGARSCPTGSSTSCASSVTRSSSGTARLFEDNTSHSLELVGQETFSTGVLNLTYVPARA